MGPKAEIPQALVGGGTAPAGAAAAAIAPPINPSDPATLTALLRIRFTDIPFMVIRWSAVLRDHPRLVRQRLTAIERFCPGMLT